jgi:hypothetical protein
MPIGGLNEVYWSFFSYFARVNRCQQIVNNTNLTIPK